MRSAAARSLRSGNSEQLLESLACPSVQVCPGQSGVSSYEERHEDLVSTPAPLPPTLAFPCQSFPYTWEAPPSRSPWVPMGLDPLLLCRRQGVGAPFPPHSTRFHISSPPWAVSQSGCEPSDLKSSLLFKAFFLAPGHT